MAKKLTREGCSLPTYFANQDFDERLVKPLGISEEESADTAENTETVLVEAVPVVEAGMIQDQIAPSSAASMPAYNIKSVEFKVILKDFLSSDIC